MQLKLLTKFTVVTSAAVLAAMIIFALINIRSLKNIFLEEAVKDVDNLSETLIRTTHYQMLENDRERVRQMIQEVGTQKGIEHIRLINKDGVIIFSTDHVEIGEVINKNAEACNMCHGKEVPLLQTSSMNRSRIFKDRTGKEVLGIARGIYTDPSCLVAECHFHGPDDKLLGVLDVIVSLEDMNSKMIGHRNGIIILTFALLLLLLTSLAALTQRVINRPVGKLLANTRRLATGNLESRIENPSGDELGELAQSFNVMAKNLRNAQKELREWGGALEARVEDRTREIRDMQKQLIQSEKMAALGEMSAGIAHEINNPLTGILMFGSIIAGDPRLDPGIKPDVDTILQETRRCGAIVQGLLEFSRNSVSHKREVSINHLLDKTLSLLEHQTLFFNIRILRLYHPALPDVMVDPNQIEQVLMNIILNAAQAMPEGGDLILKTDLREPGSLVHLEIRDTGCGIPAENLEKIFNPFFTTKGVRGTGLGLSVSYGIIDSHGGRINVDSEVGNGTTFIISLPLSPPARDARGDVGASGPAV